MHLDSQTQIHCCKNSAVALQVNSILLWGKLQLMDSPHGPGVIELSENWFSVIKGDVSKAWALSPPLLLISYMSLKVAHSQGHVGKI